MAKAKRMRFEASLEGPSKLVPERGRSRAIPVDCCAPGLLIDNPEITQVLARIVSSLSAEPCCQQDLMQEGLVHLWRMQQQRPHQSKSWYLQSCRFRLQHYLSVGRSVDSPKRRKSQVSYVPDESGGAELWMTRSGEFQHASARDMVETLAGLLKPIERAILDKLADGLATAEIARLLRLSRPTVTKYRRKIARLAQNLERMPVFTRPFVLSCQLSVRNGPCRVLEPKLRTGSSRS